MMVVAGLPTAVVVIGSAKEAVREKVVVVSEAVDWILGVMVVVGLAKVGTD